MTKIAVIAGSNRKEAESHRVGEIASQMLEEIGATADLISLRDIELPLWDESKGSKDLPEDSPWRTIWPGVSERLKAADGMVVISPEWHGMASPHLKNLLSCCTDRELAFKPGYLISVSSSIGGAYPIAELRMSGYKNNYAHWLPDHLIIRNVASFRPGAADDAAPDWLAPRMRHGLKVLCAYAEAAKPIRAEVVDLDLLRNGM
ncbi:MAG: NAD(P)H-dependent oxidoreductase [Neomegalonema sp.]|nr:NAD(P)H-dependent oxidoreductase [Neomegalonema sp.]